MIQIWGVGVGGSIEVSHLSALKRKICNILFICNVVVKKGSLCGFQLIKISEIYLTKCPFPMGVLFAVKTIFLLK